MYDDVTEALDQVLKLYGKPGREEWLNDDAFNHVCEVDRKARAVLAKARQERASLRGDNIAEFVKQKYGADVATILEDTQTVVEVMKRANGTHTLTICSRREEGDRWDDLSADLETEHFEMLGSIGKPQTQTREALSGLYGLLQLIYGRDDVGPELRSAMATNHRAIEAAKVLGAARLDEPKF